GLYYLRARYLQPDTGRFWTTDPVAGDPTDPRTLPRYPYAADAPGNHIHPSATDFTNLSEPQGDVSRLWEKATSALASYAPYARAIVGAAVRIAAEVCACAYAVSAFNTYLGAPFNLVTGGSAFPDQRPEGLCGPRIKEFYVPYVLWPHIWYNN